MKVRSCDRHVHTFPNRESLELINHRCLDSLLLVVTTLARSISMGPLAFIGGSIPLLWASGSSASSYPLDWGQNGSARPEARREAFLSGVQNKDHLHFLPSSNPFPTLRSVQFRFA